MQKKNPRTGKHHHVYIANTVLCSVRFLYDFKDIFLYVSPHMMCQQDFHVIHNHITRAQDFNFDWVYTIFTFFSTRGIASSLFSSLPSSLSPLVLPFIYFFKNRGGKGVRTAAKSFLVQFQSILSRVSQNVKCNIPSGDSVGIVRDVRGNWEIQTSAVPLSAVMSPVDPSWSSSPGSWMCDLS